MNDPRIDEPIRLTHPGKTYGHLPGRGAATPTAREHLIA
jgi:hypothetical protein